MVHWASPHGDMEELPFLPSTKMFFVLSERGLKVKENMTYRTYMSRIILQKIK